MKYARYVFPYANIEWPQTYLFTVNVGMKEKREVIKLYYYITMIFYVVDPPHPRQRSPLRLTPKKSVIPLIKLNG